MNLIDTAREAGLSNKELAEYLGVEQALVNRWASIGKAPDTIEKVMPDIIRKEFTALWAWRSQHISAVPAGWNGYDKGEKE